ncbi:FYN-binding protein 1 [Dunckerocampus dactyliophorus]|uniref:FYN-binding protein 1 n=1 Tax=Dunckerocampus dactyliophorus TaxID=161453 RepID=UPI0024070AB1|nr:FYN-binding protein 1 [Dunckerocampus dactyliophorus]XP_054646202.1 FYN-binding protein 1 [Dunckerocampus dactyliophorus]
MNQDETMDFKALRAKFQEEDLLIRQKPRMKPALPEKPKVVPSPHSPTQYLPAGARPSLLTSINQSLEGRNTLVPRVVFKDDKDSKKPLIKTNSKGLDKSEGKLRGGKDNLVKGSKELDEKKDSSKDEKLPVVTTADLLSSPVPPKAQTTKKNGLMGFKWSAKSNSDDIPADPTLDTPSLDIPGPAPVYPTPPEFEDSEPETSEAPNMFSLSDCGVESNPASPGFTPPPAFIPDIPPPNLPSSVSEAPLEMETPTLPIYIPDSQGDISPVETSPTIYQTIFSPPPEVSSPPPISIAALLNPPPRDPLSLPSSPQAENSLSPIYALERAEDMNQVRRTSPADQRILNALKNARRKLTNNVQTNNSTCATLPPEDLYLPQSTLTNLPPIDYDSMTARQLNGMDHRQGSPALEGIDQDGTEDVPELLVVPPPRPRSVPPDQVTPAAPPQKPAKPSNLKFPDFIPNSPLQQIPAVPLEFSEKDTRNVGYLDSGASPKMPQWTNGGSTSPDIPAGVTLPPSYSNGVVMPGATPQGATGFGVKYPDQPPPYQAESAFFIPLDSQAMAGHNSVATGNSYYDDMAKKKAKSDGGKKRKGPPKNPYAEASQELNEEKTKTGRLGKNDKNVVEGPDEKELKKREKQRLEREKKELKERQEREKKEQKEKEKREKEMKKKFKISGYEEAMYYATVTVTTKGRKDDLPVSNGDSISIIRTTNCPKGKWLARDFANNYGYVAVDHVELDIKEMLELGKKAAPTHTSKLRDSDVANTGSNIANHFPHSAESFSDDSEEWAADDDETFPSPTNAVVYLPDAVIHSRAFSLPDVGNPELHVNHQHSHSDVSAGGAHEQAKNEALQKLTTFFRSPKTVQPTAGVTEHQTSLVHHRENVVHQPQASSIQEEGFEHPDMLILPPPELYADVNKE